jgi:PAT family beta-lactamase induction signal transducer AmpG
VQITVNADPNVPYVAAAIPGSTTHAADTVGAIHFYATDADIKVATAVPNVDIYVEGSDTPVSPGKYAAMMRDSVQHLNERNGFVGIETAAKAAAADNGPNAFTQWLKTHFGEERKVADKANNIAIVGVRLSKKPDTGTTIILNVTYQSGDQSIRLEQNRLSTRFEFNENNWDKTAYLYFDIDHKLTKPATATFEGASGNIPFAWLVVFVVLSAFFFIVSIYHSWALPRPLSDRSAAASTSASDILHEFIETFKSFFRKRQIWVAIAFMLLYRLPEAQMVKLINPFLLDPIDKGGLGLTTGQVGLVYGTVGIIGLTLGGIIGGIVAARGGLRKWLWPMAWSMSLTCLSFVYLSYFQDHSLLTVNICVFIEQFGYGFGFTAYMLYLIYFSEGAHKTAHYAICTGFMALGMMLPGMAAGWLQETIGYRHFFVWTIICCAATIGVCAFLKIDPSFGRKEVKE